MTPEGYRILYDTFAADPKTKDKVRVSPEPQQGEDVRDVEVMIRGNSSKAFFEVLGKAGLGPSSDKPHPDPNAPKLALNFLAATHQPKDRVTMRFKDLNAA